jgi:hypothetical protein
MSNLEAKKQLNQTVFLASRLPQDYQGKGLKLEAIKE